jgi:sensor c-di-GMP phosphodiesterase-like protein
MISQFIVTQIENNADKLLHHRNAKEITRYILNQVFKDLGDTLIS